jgi:hypothetical protein
MGGFDCRQQGLRHYGIANPVRGNDQNAMHLQAPSRLMDAGMG